MTSLNVNGQSFTLNYDAENRFVSVSGDETASFAFDGDGKRVKSVMGSETVLFVSAHYEIKNGSEITKYYMAGSTRIATLAPGASAGVRKYTAPQPMTVEYMLSDHLGSTSLTTDANGAKVLELRYKAWGEIRATWTSSPSTTPAYKMPLYQFTGQASYLDDPTTVGVTEGFGLMFYQSRFYDPQLGRFTQADTMIPQSQGIQAWDRYAYTNNNPVRYIDPSGHCIICVGLIVGAIIAVPMILSGLGARADVEGAMVASAVTMNQNSDILVQAGIAVQSEYPLGIVGGGEQGWAQANNEELNGRNPFSPSASVDVMSNRIYNAIGNCKQCNSAVDKLVVAALAQNGFDFSPKGIGRFPMKDGNINWGEFLSNNGGDPSSGIARMRQDVTDRNYDTQLMLKIYMQDLQLLVSMGYELPDWLTEEDIQTIVDNDYFYEEEEE